MVRVLELKAATSWCQNFPAEGQNRDAISSSAIRDGGSHGLRGVRIHTDRLAGSERFQSGPFQKWKTGTPLHNSESSSVQFSYMGDGVATVLAWEMRFRRGV